MVACGRYGHSRVPRMGKPFHVVHEALVQLCSDVQQVQDGVHGSHSASGDPSYARILCS